MSKKLAVQELLDAANSGDVQAQCELGKCYADGEIVEQDYKKSLYWFNEAEKNGDVMAVGCLGVMYELGRGVEADINKAIEYYQRAAYENDSTGTYNIGLCYFYGKGIVKENKRRAINYITEVAEAGFVKAMKFLITFYSEHSNFEESFYWLEQVALTGDDDCQLRVGRCYEKGTSFVEPDKEKAFEWYLKAAEQGNEQAMERVNVYYASKLYDFKLPK